MLALDEIRGKDGAKVLGLHFRWYRIHFDVENTWYPSGTMLERFDSRCQEFYRPIARRFYSGTALDWRVALQIYWWWFMRRCSLPTFMWCKVPSLWAFFEKEFNQGVVETLRNSRPNVQLTKRDESLVERILVSGDQDETKVLTHDDLHQSNIIVNSNVVNRWLGRSWL